MKVTNWHEAAERGLTHYCTGEPCPRGHLAPRYVSNKGCTECARLTPAQKTCAVVPRTFTFPDLHPDDHETLRTFARCLQQARMAA